MSMGVIEALDEAIDAIADLDVDTLTDGALDQLVIDLQRCRHRLAGVTAGPLARWDASGSWRSDGSRSATTRLARDASTSTTTAAVDLRRARKLAAMPATAAAVSAGRVSMDHVDLLGRADQPHRHQLFVRDETLLVEQCATLRHTQAVRAVEYWIQSADTETGDSAEPAKPASSLHASTTWKGTVRIDGTLDRLDGAIVTGELDRLERLQYLADQAAGITRSAGQRRAAALVEMAARSASTPPGTQRPKPLYTVILGDDSFTTLCELGTGTVITPGTLIPHLGVAEIETILFDGPFTAIAASTGRSFTGRLRRAIEIRDRHCQHPSGCDTPAHDCDVDHIIPYVDGGATDQFNGRLECRPTTATPTSTTTTASPTLNDPSPSSTRSAPTSAGNTSTKTATEMVTTTTTPTLIPPTSPPPERSCPDDHGDECRVNERSGYWARTRSRHSVLPVEWLVPPAAGRAIRRSGAASREACRSLLRPTARGSSERAWSDWRRVARFRGDAGRSRGATGAGAIVPAHPACG